MNPKISIVIPIKNAAGWLDKLIESLLSQTLAGSSEIILIDSGSEDNSVEIIKGYPEITLIQIDPQLFNHGATRNLGISKAKGEFVVFTVQDALPVDNLWLQNLSDGFVNEKIAAVCGKQIVLHDLDKNPVQWHRPVAKPITRVYQFKKFNDFNILSPENKKEICSWDNVNAMYRREILLKLPFSNTPFAEDALWAKNTIEAGIAVAYNPAAVVSHYHYENFNFTYRRTLVEVFYTYKIFKKFPDVKRYNLKYYLQITKLLFFETKVPPFEKLKWFNHNYKQTVAIKKAMCFFMNKYNEGANALLELEKEISKTVPQGNGASN